MAKKLFPKYLAKNTRNTPQKRKATKLLQLLLLGAGHNPRIIPDGDFGDETERGVIKLQERIGFFPPGGRDGTFGPMTRDIYKNRTGLDIDAIPANFFDEAPTPTAKRKPRRVTRKSTAIALS